MDNKSVQTIDTTVETTEATIAMVERFLNEEKDDAREWLQKEIATYIDSIMVQLVEKQFSTLRDKFITYIHKNGQSTIKSTEKTQTNIPDEYDQTIQSEKQKTTIENENNSKSFQTLSGTLTANTVPQPLSSPSHVLNPMSHNIKDDISITEEILTNESKQQVENKQHVDDDENDDLLMDAFFEYDRTEMSNQKSSLFSIAGYGKRMESATNGGHLKPSHVVITRKLKCLKSECDEMFDDKAALDSHMFDVHHIKPYRCEQRDCGQSFDDWTQLYEHIGKSHGSEPIWMCGHEQCSTTTTEYKTYQLLATHTVQKHHLGLFQCAFIQCPFTADCRRKVYTHYNRHRKQQQQQQKQQQQHQQQHQSPSSSSNGFIETLKNDQIMAATNLSVPSSGTSAIIGTASTSTIVAPTPINDITPATIASQKTSHEPVRIISTNGSLQSELSIVADSALFNEQNPIITLELQCLHSMCDQMFLNQDDLNEHMICQHPDEVHRCLQRDCTQSFSKQSLLEEHQIQAHCNETIWRCGHDRCRNKSTTYSHYSQLVHHTLIMHEIGKFKCSFPNCEYIGSHRSVVYSHYYNQHKSIARKVPNQLKMSMNGIELLHGSLSKLSSLPNAFNDIESKNDDEDNSNFYCGEMTNDSSHMIRSLFQLPSVSSSSSSAPELVRPKQESRIVITELLCCNVETCPMAKQCLFKNQSMLDTHMQEIHSISAFRCVQRDCGASFDDQLQLDEHIKEGHTNGTKWMCGHEQCVSRGIEYRYYSQLAQHTINNHQSGQFRCAFFDCTFIGTTRRKVYTHYYNRHKKRASRRRNRSQYEFEFDAQSRGAIDVQTINNHQMNVDTNYHQNKIIDNNNESQTAIKRRTLSQPSIIVPNPMHVTSGSQIESTNTTNNNQTFALSNPSVIMAPSIILTTKSSSDVTIIKQEDENGIDETAKECDDADESDEEIDVVGDEDDEIMSRSIPSKRSPIVTTSSDQAQHSKQPSPQVGNNVRKSKNIITKELKCLVSSCMVILYSQSELDIHMTTTHPEEAFRCLQKGCERSFDDQAKLWAHIENDHPENPINGWSCGHERCSWKATTYNTYLQLYSHTVYNHHLGVFGCAFPGCTFSAETRKRVYGHHSNYHPKRSFTCRLPGCNKEIKIKKDLIAHEHTHIGIKPYRCNYPGCGFGSAYRHITKKHIRTEHLIPEVPIDAIQFLDVDRQSLDPNNYLSKLCTLHLNKNLK
ncbi:hypothetical protein RDWZM_004985 [Blomia tropicalis]|uniref:C2H2-type domain-containing protein n=1 Tax=Blomia tropicalis TaxID=40697 RepID=A0A9Q0RKH4_BLOTA|nr:hypothetical protein RDWZM_004985 [Blomia tropicalis]